MGDKRLNLGAVEKGRRREVCMLVGGGEGKWGRMVVFFVFRG